jgi:hypothetical protein
MGIQDDTMKRQAQGRAYAHCGYDGNLPGCYQRPYNPAYAVAALVAQSRWAIAIDVGGMSHTSLVYR